MFSTVEATDFYLEYDFEGRTATDNEFEQASVATLSYIDDFMRRALESNPQIRFNGQQSHTVGFVIEPVTIAYSYEAYFLEAPGIYPKPSELDRLLSTALSRPANNALLKRLDALGSNNPFSRTVSISYSLEFVPPKSRGEVPEEAFKVPGSAIALLVVGIILGICGLGMVVMRRRRFRRQVQPDEELEGRLISTGEGYTTLSDSEESPRLGSELDNSPHTEDSNFLTHTEDSNLPTITEDSDPQTHDKNSNLFSSESSLIDAKWSMPCDDEVNKSNVGSTTANEARGASS